MTFAVEPVSYLVRRSLSLLVMLLFAVPAFASLSVRASGKAAVDIAIANEPLSAAVAALQPFLGRPVHLLLAADPSVTFRATHVTAEDALRTIVKSANLELADENGRLWIRDSREPTVALDVKDADVHEILKSMQQQCGIRNLMIDPQVRGTGTFLFRDVPCRIAFDVVLRSLGLSSTEYDNSVVAVSIRTR